MIFTRFRSLARRHALPALLAAASLYPAVTLAQGTGANTDSAPSDETRLELTASGTVQAQPDQLTATFFAESRADTAAAAQAQVNSLIGKAISAAAQTPDLTVNAESYFVQHEDADTRQSRRARWVARQTIRLTAADGKTLLPLVGQLQAENLALMRLDWSVSRKKRAELTRQAETLALQDMQQRAHAAADTLKLKISSLASVSLDDQDMPRPMPMMMARAASADMMAPSAPTGMQDVTATARATVLLTP
ncbi:SIMPL domain-containing protein [Komagataeibacter saccharivorans]|uniref:SIMPL domain-containing protein n=1 Tax=Komagataeibacter saccharivorans TaxID=265959 RepID=UPI000C82AAF6|nr:SIMPL domain-containing protein [Komagataeibacter saccharivorans]